MYIYAILGYLSWPLLVIASFYLVKWALRVYERRHGS